MIKAEQKGDGCQVQIQGNSGSLQEEFSAIVKGMHDVLTDHTGSASMSIKLLLCLMSAALIAIDDEEDEYASPVDSVSDAIREALRKEHEGE